MNLSQVIAEVVAQVHDGIVAMREDRGVDCSMPTEVEFDFAVDRELDELVVSETPHEHSHRVHFSVLFVPGDDDEDLDFNPEGI